MRIGELLVEQRKLRPSELSRALAEKPADRRLCSFLIAQGLVDFDDASRALGEQQGVPCALAKHLAGRDPSLAALIPPELGRASCALPIGRTSRGELIVCVRDPSPAVFAQLRQATRTEILMVIAPANRLEHLVLGAYGAAPSDELDIDVDMDAGSPPMPDMDALDPASVRLALTDLDDERVDRDPSQAGRPSGSIPVQHAPSEPPARPPRAQTEPPARPSSPPARAGTAPPAPPTTPAAARAPSNPGVPASSTSVPTPRATPPAGVPRPTPPSSPPPPRAATSPSSPAPMSSAGSGSGPTRTGTGPNTVVRASAEPPSRPARDLEKSTPSMGVPIIPPEAMASRDGEHTTPSMGVPIIPPEAMASRDGEHKTPSMGVPIIPPEATRPPASTNSVSANTLKRTPPSGVASVATPRGRTPGSEPRVTRPMSIPMMSVGLEHTTSREGATDLVLAYVATRWISGLVLAIRDRSANGFRGHGVSMPELVSVPLNLPSTLQRAIETKLVSDETPASAAQDALARALDNPSSMAAAPVLVNGQAVAVIVVGAPIDREAPPSETTAELGLLADALSTAFSRIGTR